MDGDIDDVSHDTDSDGNPNVFKLERNDDGLWLNDNWAKPDNEWRPGHEFVVPSPNKARHRRNYGVTTATFGLRPLL